MSRMLRRASIGILAGLVAGTALVMTLAHPLPILIIAGLVGAAYSASLNPTKGTYVDNLMAGGALGIPLWGLISVVAIPVLSGRQPESDG
jgi:hypothetical protein